MDRRVPFLAHKLPGAQGCLPCFDSFSPRSWEASCNSQDGQQGSVSGGSLGFHSDAGPFGSCPDIQFYSMSGLLQARPSCLCRYMPQAARPHGSGWSPPLCMASDGLGRLAPWQFLLGDKSFLLGDKSSSKV